MDGKTDNGSRHIARQSAPAWRGYEKLALDYLLQRGLTLITKNFRSRCGEIDLIMRDHSCLVFVEVRFRKTTHFGGGAASVTPAKQRRIINTAKFFLQTHKKDPACRFDVIEISSCNNIEGKTTYPINWIPNAFT